MSYAGMLVEPAGFALYIVDRTPGETAMNCEFV